MRLMLRPLAVLTLALATLALPAGAAVLPVSATYSLQLVDNGFIPAIGITGSGIGSSNGLGAAFSVPAGMFSGHGAVYAGITPTFVGLTNLSIPANSVNNPAATFNPGGVMAMSGAAFFNYGAGGQVPLHPYGGAATSNSIIGGIPVKGVGQSWQYAAAKVFTAMGAALSNAISATATAFDNRTAAGRGAVQLVAPGYLLISGGTLGNLPVFATLSLTYTPEPGTLVLLGSGVAMLAAIGRRRLQR